MGMIGYSKSTLPNQTGFQFRGLFADGEWRDCEVEFNEYQGIHTVANYSELVSWLPAIKTKQVR